VSASLKDLRASVVCVRSILVPKGLSYNQYNEPSDNIWKPTWKRLIDGETFSLKVKVYQSIPSFVKSFVYTLP
jgi:hypothetical protein